MRLFDDPGLVGGRNVIDPVFEAVAQAHYANLCAPGEQLLAL